MILFSPRLTWFYDAYIEHEYAQVVSNWQDKLEEVGRQYITLCKEQIDFFNIHKEYIFIKKRSLSNVHNSYKNSTLKVKRKIWINIIMTEQFLCSKTLKS
jgi:hypothetical protein